MPLGTTAPYKNHRFPPEIIAHAVGGRGPNTEYLSNTVEHLHELGIADNELDWLNQRVRELTRIA